VAKEWGHLNVRCNAIAYGWIDTRLTRSKEGGEAILVGGEQVGFHRRMRIVNYCMVHLMDDSHQQQYCSATSSRVWR
jgi:NAD(P)-dependent dehydrogenase (short-subunit alcohol dehydrogenase family)